MLGEKELCAESLRRAIDGGFFNSPYMLKDPNLAPMRDDPAIAALMREAKTKRDVFLRIFNLDPGVN